jgi:hypothetical protein
MKKNFKTNVNIPEIEIVTNDSELSLFDRGNPDINLFNLVDEENIRLSGSKINYYKFIQSNEFDQVYLEQKNKPISPNAIIVYGHYDPKVIEEPLNQFGINITSDQLFTFNKSYLDKKLGRPPIAGDVVHPHFQNVKYEIFEVQEDSFEAYGVYHYVCTAKVLRDSEDIQDMPKKNVAPPVGKRDIDGY